MTKFECHIKVSKTLDQKVKFSPITARLMCWRTQIETINMDVHLNSQGKFVYPIEGMEFKNVRLEDEYICKLVEWVKIAHHEKHKEVDDMFRLESFELVFEEIPASVKLFELQLDFIYPKPNTLYERNDKDEYYLYCSTLKLLC